LKIDQNEELSSIEIANSDNLKIGDIVLAIGNPYGLGQSVSMGIVSATGREFNNPYSDYIQTDASINQGNSGGALIDTTGRLVGINTLIRSSTGGSEGVGLAIPSARVLGIINDLIQYGEVKRGWLGFGIDRRVLATQNLLKISYIHPNGPAEEVNLEEGDIIIQINEQKSSYPLLFKEFARSKPGTIIKFKILRNGNYLDIDLLTSTVSS
jgi:S1-C subfamily serine protease